MLKKIEKYWPLIFFIPLFISDSFNSFGVYAHSIDPIGKSAPLSIFFLLLFFYPILKSKKLSHTWCILLIIYMLVASYAGEQVRHYFSLLLLFFAVALGARLNFIVGGIRVILFIYSIIIINTVYGLFYLNDIKYLAGFVNNWLVIYNFEQYFAFSSLILFIIIASLGGVRDSLWALANSIGLSIISQNYTALIISIVFALIYGAHCKIKKIKISTNLKLIIIIVILLTPLLLFAIFVNVSGLIQTALQASGGLETRVAFYKVFMHDMGLNNLFLPSSVSYYGGLKYTFEWHNTFLTTISYFGFINALALFTYIVYLLLIISRFNYIGSVLLALFISMAGLTVEIFYHPFIAIQLGMTFGLLLCPDCAKEIFVCNKKTLGPKRKRVQFLNGKCTT
jgi:hypothetical protein